MCLGFDGALSQSQMTASPGFCLFSLHFTNTGSDVFTFCALCGVSAHERNTVWMLKEVTVYFLKMLLRSQWFFLYCSLDGQDE